MKTSMAMYRETFIHSVTISRSSCTDGNDTVDCKYSRVCYLKIQNDIPKFTSKMQYNIIISQSPKTENLKIVGERGTVMNSEKYD